MPAYSQKRFSNFGVVSQQLEQEITAAYCPPGREAVLAASGTAGITAGLMALGITGNVALPSFTFPATLQAVLAAGCVPLLADVDPVTWELSPAALDTLASKTSLQAVVAVRSFGLCRDMSALEISCRGLGIPLILDSAAACGGQLPDGRFAGGEGMLEVFSLHATKVFAVGEGGVIFAPHHLAAPLKRAMNFGLMGDVLTPGFNGKVSEITAAVGLAVLRHMPAFLQRRSELGRLYARFFAHYPAIDCASDPGSPPWQCFPALFPRNADVAAIQRQALEAGLELRRYYHPALHVAAKSSSSTAPVPLAVSEDLASRMLCFPVYSDMTAEEHDRVLAITAKLLNAAPVSP